jgi:hypothetical protein
MLIEILIALILVQLVAGAMIAMASAIAIGIPNAGLEDKIVKVMIAIASLTIPLDKYFYDTYYKKSSCLSDSATSVSKNR